MASIRIFDIDQALKPDPKTKDLVDIYNVDAINQSIDIFIANPYRIGEGLSNTIFSILYADFQTDDLVDLQNALRDAFDRDFPLLTIENLDIYPDPALRRIRVQMSWSLTGYTLSGDYNRFWQTK